jgi:hypothetical protein
MRTSLNNIKSAEDYLLHQSTPEDHLLFEAQLLLSSELKENLLWQKKTYQLVKLYGRKKLKEELEQVHNELFTTNKGFRNKILSFFKKT